MNPDLDDLADQLDGDLSLAARALGRRGGLTRGKAKQRSREHYERIGKLGAQKRWQRNEKGEK